MRVESISPSHRVEWTGQGWGSGFWRGLFWAGSVPHMSPTPQCPPPLVAASTLSVPHPDRHDVSEHLQRHEHAGSLNQHQHGRAGRDAACLTAEPGAELCHTAAKVYDGASRPVPKAQGSEGTLGVGDGAILPGVQAAGGRDAARLHSWGTAVEVPVGMDKES